MEVKGEALSPPTAKIFIVPISKNIHVYYALYSILSLQLQACSIEAKMSKNCCVHGVLACRYNCKLVYLFI